jgi:Nif-specific regulatory protein
LVIGRNVSCQVRIQDPIISRRHCEIWHADTGLRIRDLNSSNQTRVNGTPIIEAELHEGDQIALGPYLFAIRVGSKSQRQQPDIPEDSMATISLSEAFYVKDAAPTGASESISDSVSEFRELLRMQREMTQASSVNELVRTVAAALRRKFKPDVLWLAQFVGADRRLVPYPLEAEKETQKLPVDEMIDAIEKLSGAVMARRVPAGEGSPLETTMVAPLSVGDERIGAIALRARMPNRVYDEADVEFLLGVAHALGPGLRALRAVEQLRRDFTHCRGRAGQRAELIGECDAMRRVRDIVGKAARTDLPVLILGATGTGKELVARMIHDQSPRAGNAYVTVNCAAIPRDLFESEMFGFERGAFTGATRKKIGIFEEAHGGTLFLDEVGDLAPDNQARILRAIETGSFNRVGGNHPVQVDVRFVSATNQPIPELVRQGRFREDLYHRLKGFEITVPRLRERGEDIILLAKAFIEEFRQQSGTRAKRFTPEAEHDLRSAPWSGNVRELRATIERATALAEGEVIDSSHLGLDPATPAAVPLAAWQRAATQAVPASELSLADLERRHIEAVLREKFGNIKAAAKALAISRATLYKKLKDYNIPY